MDLPRTFTREAATGRQAARMCYFNAPAEGVIVEFCKAIWAQSSGGSGVFILGATGVATLSSGGTQLILSG